MKIKFLFSLLTFLFFLLVIDLHPQQPGEIVFSKKLIDATNPSNLTSQFQAGDHIYALAFFPNDIAGMRGREDPKKVDVEIFLYELKPPLYDYQQPQEQQMEFSTMHVSGEALKKNI